DGAVQQRLEVLLAVLLAPEQLEHLHVAGIGSAAVADLGGDEAAAHDFGQRRVLEVRQARAGARVRVKKVPQTAFSGLNLELLDDRRLEVRVAGFTHLVFVYPLGRVHIRLDEVEQLGLQLLGAFGNVKQGHGNSSDVVE